MKNAKTWWYNYSLILAVCFLTAFTNSIFSVVLPVYVLDIGGTNATTGLMATGLTVAIIVARLASGVLTDRWGRKKTFFLGSMLYALSTVGHCFSSGILGLFVLRILSGIAQGVFFPVGYTMIADTTSNEKMLSALGGMGVATIPAAFSPTLGLWVYQRFGVQMLFIMCALCTAIAVCCVVGLRDSYIPPQGIQGKKIKTERWNLSRQKLMPFMCGLLTSFGMASVNNFLLPYGEAREITYISWYFSLNTIVSVLTKAFAGPVAKRMGGRKALRYGVLLQIAGLLVIAFAQNIWWILLAAILLGHGNALTSQLLHTLVFAGAEEHQRGKMNSLYMLFQDVGGGLGASVWGFCSTYLGYYFTFLLSAGSALPNFVFMQKPKNAKEQVLSQKT